MQINLIAQKWVPAFNAKDETLTMIVKDKRNMLDILARTTHFHRNVETGCVMVKLPTVGIDYHGPFGGRENSSFELKHQGRYAVEFCWQVKMSSIREGAPN